MPWPVNSGPFMKNCPERGVWFYSGWATGASPHILEGTAMIPARNVIRTLPHLKKNKILYSHDNFSVRPFYLRVIENGFGLSDGLLTDMFMTCTSCS